ncbi:MAG: LLM class flavin-dependent oxidoreductase [Rhodospirillaceae bacterium]|nr:LLM class flavin-dependent oxidoreductase [Rhodospirillaceae bacterium]MDD9928456.1 LLM class flavin-dependent oxidoreductase [Rhodospirillaceae bacterium]
MGVGVGLGIAEFPFSSARKFWDWIELCEEGGVDSFWQIDRMVSREPFLECMSSMAALAGATKKLKFGMNVASVGLRDPLLLAKECATIDFLSEGRLLPAFGIGNNAAPVWKATGRPTKRRGIRTNEALELITRLWKEDSVTFEGEFYQYHEACISPKPVQKKIPLWLGGSSDAAIRRTARYGTGWLAGLETPQRVAPVIAGIKEAAKEAGRPIDADHFGASFPFRFGDGTDDATKRQIEAFRKRPGLKDRDPNHYFAIGDTEDVIAKLREFVAAGAFKFVMRPIANNDDEMMSQTQRLIDEVFPVVYDKGFEASAAS